MRRLAALAVLALVAMASARWMMPGPVPIDRLIANTEAALKGAPKDARLHYLLGRLHSLAFATRESEVRVFTHDSIQPPFEFAGFISLQVKRDEKAQEVTTADVGHLRASLEEYQTATKLAPSEGLYLLGLAWMLEQGAPYVDRLRTLSWLQKPTTATMRDSAMSLYQKLYRLRRDEELKRATAFRGLGDGMLSREAAEGMKRLKKLGVAGLTKQLEEDLDKTIDILSKKPVIVTPILFPLGPSLGLADLIDTSARARFDLAGDGSGSSWPWPTTNAAFLAWDPECTGRITSARQLFGGSTFWMSYRNGYEAMASLDNDLDGKLSGTELVGIVVWHDRNGNAISDSGEVAPASNWGVEQIAVRASGLTGLAPWANQGIVWRDGRVSPTYDWTPTSH